ncbi:MAG: ABC transporter permease [Candidatus Heimdallarchaeota archaeon]|nr:ABC transporter permease [Candidatus Heimdallarchaeota archaeon]
MSILDPILAIISDEEVVSSLTRFLGSLLLFLIILFSVLRTEKSMQSNVILSTFRGLLQIVILGSILNIIFTLRHTILLFGVITIMIGFGAQTAAKRHEIRDLFRVYLLSLGISVYIIMVTMSLLGVLPIDEPEFWIPIGGMITGNSMNITYLTISNIEKDMKQRKGEIETALALGFTPQRIYSKLSIGSKAIVLAITPTTNNLRTLGLVFIPGLMTGLLIGGISPIAAALLQVMIFLLILSGGLLSAFISVKLILPYFFDMDNQNLLQ